MIEYKGKENIVDIILTSSLKSKDFLLGQSDLDFLIIVDNNCHPKTILNDFRKFINTSSQLRITINQTYIPILTESELKTDTIKSFLIRKSYQDIVKWESICFKKDYVFHLRKQDHFAIIYNSIQSLDFHFLKEGARKSNRTRIKSIYRSIQNLKKFYPQDLTFPRKWKERSHFLQSFPIFSTLGSKTFFSNVWQVLTTHLDEHKKISKYQEVSLDPKFIKYLNSLLSIDFIKDFTLTPTLIQRNQDKIQGKLFIDIHVDQNICLKNYIQQIDNLKMGIKEYETEKLKFRIRLTSSFLYKIQNEYAYYPFPLEALYRKQKTYSINKFKYDYLINHEHIILASIHFLTTQFMRFRSLQQKTDLIGSKFIKSLNLMYKYYLVSEYLKGNEFKLEASEKAIRESLTPQFSDINSLDDVTEEQWKIIQAQLLYLLKDIRDELVKYDPTLKILRF